MSDIFNNALKIIAIPDMSYNQSFTSFLGFNNINNITIEDISEYIYNKKIPNCFGKKRKSININPIINVISDWASRAWINSEIYIGLRNNNLTVIILSLNLDITNCFEILNENNKFIIDETSCCFHYYLIDAIINCKSEKYEDRIYSFLSLTNYKEKVFLIMKNISVVKNIFEIKMILINIFNMKGKIIMLQREIKTISLLHDNINPNFPTFFVNEGKNMVYHKNENDIGEIHFKDIKSFDNNLIINTNKYKFIDIKKLKINNNHKKLTKELLIENDDIISVAIILYTLNNNFLGNNKEHKYVSLICLGNGNKWIVYGIDYSYYNIKDIIQLERKFKIY